MNIKSAVVTIVLRLLVAFRKEQNRSRVVQKDCYDGIRGDLGAKRIPLTKCRVIPAHSSQRHDLMAVVVNAPLF